MRLQTKEEIGAHFISYDAMRWLGRGTAFPTAGDGVTLAAGDRFFRSDLLMACVYDGAQWLSEHEYSDVVTQAISSAVTFTTNYITLRSDLRPYFTRAVVVTSVATTNNGSNYWNVTIQSANLAVSATTQMYTFNTSSDTAGARTRHEGAATNALPTNWSHLRISAATNGSPGALEVSATAYYRLVVEQS